MQTWLGNQSPAEANGADWFSLIAGIVSTLFVLWLLFSQRRQIAAASDRAVIAIVRAVKRGARGASNYVKHVADASDHD